MRRFFKTLLLWLCILSLPVQGMAAVTRLSCAPAHHQAVQVWAADHAGHDHHASHGDAMAHDHHQQDQQGQQQGADKCSVCASCCTGLGFVATFPQWPVAPPAHAPWVATFKPLLPSFLPEGLERPPRSDLA
jgi:hypothetical protein